MSRMSMFLAFLAVSVFAVGLSGCGSAGESDQPAATATQTPADSGGDQAADAPAVPAESAAQAEQEPSTSAMPETFAKLSPEDQKLALAQKICPVSGEALGEEDTPIKVTVNDRTVFLCCGMCKAKLDADPDKYLAKLDK